MLVDAEYRSPNDLRGVFQDTERQEQDALLKELEELERRDELPQPTFDFELSNKDYLELERSLGDATTVEEKNKILRRLGEINRLEALARSGKLYAR